MRRFGRCLASRLPEEGSVKVRGALKGMGTRSCPGRPAASFAARSREWVSEAMEQGFFGEGMLEIAFDMTTSRGLQ